MPGNAMGSSSNERNGFCRKSLVATAAAAASVPNTSAIIGRQRRHFGDARHQEYQHHARPLPPNQRSVRAMRWKTKRRIFSVKRIGAIIRMGKCGGKTTPPQAASLRKTARSECIERSQTFHERQVQCDENNRHQGECRRHRHIANRPLLGINHIADKISWRTNQLRDDKIAQCE